MKVDLHCHSTASDGTLSPDDLLQRARDRGVDMLAITDHDTVAAYSGLNPGARGIHLVGGIELSCLWHKYGLHIVGLGVDTGSDAMGDAVARQGEARGLRAEMIAERLAKYGVEAPLEGALVEAGSAVPGRPHFARHMVKSGFVTDEKTAFKKFLGTGKSCDIKAVWPDLQHIIAWIRDAGGVAVVAHPGKYKLSRTRLQSLMEDFTAAGGEALEVVSGRQLPADTRLYAGLCRQFGLQASWGSDFHSPDQGWLDLGSYSTPPADVDPVWHRWL